MKTKLAITIAIVALGVVGAAAATAQTAPSRARILAELRAKHLPMRLDGPFKYEFFRPVARAYWNPSGEVLLWQFKASALARVAAARIRPDGNAIGGTRVLWKGLPHWFRRGCVIALYLGANKTMSTALERVLGRQVAGI